MDYFLTILANTFKFWSYTDQYGKIQTADFGTAFLMWSITILFFYGLYCIKKNSDHIVKQIRKGIIGLTVCLGLYGLSLIFAVLGGEFPEQFRVQFLSNGLSSLLATSFWGLFCYFILNIFGLKPKEIVAA